MPRLRQLPELYLRGALATQTMRHLNDEEKELVGRTFMKVLRDLGPAPRVNFSRALGRTIKCDYRDDYEIGEQDYMVAIWKGVVQILLHHKYTYRCESCADTNYRTQRGKLSPIDRTYGNCPACGVTRIVDPGDSGLAAGSYIHKDQLQKLLQEMCSRELPEAPRTPTTGSPITPVPGAPSFNRKEYERILSDPEHKCKFFTRYATNYLRQILKENEIRRVRTRPHSEWGPADLMAVGEVLGVLDRHSVRHQAPPPVAVERGWYTISCKLLSYPAEVTDDLGRVVDRFLEYGVEIVLANDAVRIPCLPAPMVVESSVSTTIPVLVATSQQSIRGDGVDNSQYTIDSMEYRLVGGCRVKQESHVHTITRQETMSAIRNALPEHGQVVFDIYSEEQWSPNGLDIWPRFSERFDTAEGHKAKIGHIALFLDIPPREVEKYRKNIRHHLMVHDIVQDKPEEDYD